MHTKTRQPPAPGVTDLDARGLLCPEPIALAQRRLAAMEPGARLRVHTSDPAAPLDFEAWCLRRGHRYLACEEVPGGHRITVARAGG